ncbi:hypothetical protein IscW_ISCW020640 [Ixodes scapularis]|uniref:Apple domain-containing protein n=1 Tax=Ixodes scapularis TaxID=6945 RepID=B7Q2N4_IXOSC|nr:hypothetical protein IscW_ISCW020640 [Ixodes scapularis]|eukprot:XP_002410914.1 hypothetical protein IscW_ISCW020640 [Ixodes scapularis]
MRSPWTELALPIWTAWTLCLVIDVRTEGQPRELPSLRDVQFWDKTPAPNRNEQCPQGEDTITFEKTASPRCLGVVVNYEHNACFAATGLNDDEVASTLGAADQPMVPASDRSNYFAKMCVHGPTCEKDWAMERVPGKELRGFDERVVSGVPSCQRCQELCLHESSFPCRSGEFDARARECRLSVQDRRAQPAAFGPAQGPHVHYFENLCLPREHPDGSVAEWQDFKLFSHACSIAILDTIPAYDVPGRPVSDDNLSTFAEPSGSNCDFDLHKDVDLRRPDQVRSAFSADQCRSMCESCQEFACRSFSFSPTTGLCSMSGDDTVSIGGFALRVTPGTGYYQKPSCPDPVQLSCTRESMALTLRTKDPFGGRIYPRDETPGCEFRPRSEGDDARDGTPRSALRSLRGLSECGVHGPGCRGAGSSGRSPGVVNATAPSPNVRLRITDRSGADVAGARLGDELFLRIEMDDDTSTTTTTSTTTRSPLKQAGQPTMLPEYPLQREIIVQGIGGRGSDSGIYTSRDRPSKADSRMVCATPSVLTAAVVAAFLVQLALFAACLSCVALARRCGSKRHDIPRSVDDDEESDTVTRVTATSVPRRVWTSSFR